MAKALKAAENIWYVGVQDPDLRVFDIVMYTEYGTSYNSYLVRGKDKTVLFETVKVKFIDEHIEKIRSVCDPSEIDYIVLNHTEPDHSGSLAKMLDVCKNAEVLASASAIRFLKKIVNAPFPHRTVTEKDVIDLGGMSLNFISVPMLHWPDSMYTLIPEIKAIFTCDSFGCHYADEKVFNDLIEGDFYDAYKYYFDNIIGPYKNPHMLAALNKIEQLDIEFIGNGHGPVLRTNLKKYIDMYRQWCTPQDKKEKKAVIAYVSSYGYTAALADRLAKGIKKAGVKNVLMFDLVTDDKTEAAAEIASADGVLLGSPTLVGDALPPVYEMLLGLNPVIHKGKLALAFGSYAWSGEAVGNLTAVMERLKLDTRIPGLKVMLNPSVAELDEAEQLGKKFGEALLEK